MSQVYSSPDFYYAKETVTGEAPAGSSKWQALQIPADLKTPIVFMAASQLHRNAEQGVALYQQATAALTGAVVEASRRDGRHKQRYVPK
jgi:hypothetical protein